MKKICILLFGMFFLISYAANLGEYISGSYFSNDLKNIPHSDFFQNKSIIVWGTNSADEDELEVNEMMAYNVVDFRIKRWLNQPDNVVKIIEDNEISIADIEKFNLILVGTPGSNSVLQAFSELLPIQITEDKIVIGKETFAGDEVGIVYRYPNPINPQRQLWIISAPNYEALRFIPQKQEYCVFSLSDYNPMSDRFLELALGNFDANWQVEKVELVDNEVIDTGENDIPVYKPPASFPPPEWSRDGVMYEIFVRSFADSDGDGIGDLQGIIDKLDYLNDGNSNTDSDLGIETIWLMPIFDSPSYHCYDVRDYYRINSDYGTNEDFQKLLKEAHLRGIRVVTDLILNHCSNQHPFFQDAYGNPNSRYDQWFFFTNPANTRAHNWQFRHRPTDRAMLNPFMPAWNVNNPDVQSYLINMAKFWIDPNNDGDFTDGIDGFRCDYVKGPPPAFWKKFRYEIKSLNPDVLLLAENWDGMQSIAASFDNQFDMAFDFPFQGSVMELVSGGTATPLIQLLEEQNSILPANAVMNRFVNNHDMNRIFTRLDEKSAKLALALLLSVPGMPMLYYGDEIGMKGQKDPYDEGIRRPMEWCADNDCPEMTSWYPVWNVQPDGISVEEEQNNPNSILNYTRKLIRLREQYRVLENGKISILPVYERDDNELSGSRRSLCFLLENGTETIMAAVSLRDDRTILIPDVFHEDNLFEPLLGFSQLKRTNEYWELFCPDRQMLLFNVNKPR